MARHDTPCARPAVSVFCATRTDFRKAKHQPPPGQGRILAPHQESRMRTRPVIAGAVVFAALCVAGPAAHHSFAPHFDSSKPVNLEGTVTEYEVRNPHSYLHLAATDE